MRNLIPLSGDSTRTSTTGFGLFNALINNVNTFVRLTITEADNRICLQGFQLVSTTSQALDGGFMKILRNPQSDLSVRACAFGRDSPFSAVSRPPSS